MDYLFTIEQDESIPNTANDINVTADDDLTLTLYFTYTLFVDGQFENHTLPATAHGDIDEIDPGETIILNFDPLDQNFPGNPSNYTIRTKDTGTVTITDELGVLKLTAAPNSTKKFRTEEQYARFVLKLDVDNV